MGAWGRILALLPACCVTLGKFLKPLTGPIKCDKPHIPIGLSWGWSGLAGGKCFELGVAGVGRGEGWRLLMTKDPALRPAAFASRSSNSPHVAVCVPGVSLAAAWISEFTFLTAYLPGSIHSCLHRQQTFWKLPSFGCQEFPPWGVLGVELRRAPGKLFH